MPDGGPEAFDAARISRRQFLKTAGAAAVVVGFDPVGRRWVTAADVSAGCAFDDAPALDGVLLLDPASRQAVSTDSGNIVFRTPCAVLRPGSVADIANMVRFCRGHGIGVSMRGQAHTTHGQGLSDGLVIDNSALNRIHSIRRDVADIDSGASWKDLVLAAYERKLTPRALTGYVGLTVGGTLSVGGLGGLVGSLNTGMQIDHVRSLEVVTGKGDIVECSLERSPDLFEVVLGGLGQCGLITRARIELVPAKARARTYQIPYTDNATFFRDLRTLIERPGLDHVYALWFPGGTSLVYLLQAVVFYDPAQPPDDARLTAGIAPPATVQDTTYLDYVRQIDVVVDAFHATMSWDGLIKPWFDVWLPDSTVERYVGEVIPTLTPRDIGPGGFVLLLPQRRSRLTRPFLRVPEPDGSDWLLLFDILTTSAQPGPDPAFTSEMMDRNNRLFARARDAFGGVRYPIGSLDFTSEDWQAHYGDVWQTLVARKHRFDPGGILTPGPGIFAAYMYVLSHRITQP
jgi:cytokinin dehydrogenase